MTRLLLAFLLLPSLSFSQVLFIEPNEKGFDKPIVNKLKYEFYKITESKDQAGIIVECLVTGNYNAFKVGNQFHGYVKFTDSKTGKELSRTKEVGKSPGATNGYNAGRRIMEVIADKYLIKSASVAIDRYNQNQ